MGSNTHHHQYIEHGFYQQKQKIWWNGQLRAEPLVPPVAWYWLATGFWLSLQPPRQQHLQQHLVIYYDDGDSSYIHNYGSKYALQHGYPHALPYSMQYPKATSSIWPLLYPPYRLNIMRVNPWLREDLHLASISMIKQLLGQQPTIYENRLLPKQAADHWKCAILRIK